MNDPRPNIILLTVDSLRADCVGGAPERTLTPHLDRVAETAVVFTQAFSQGPYTTLSMPSLFTGLYPSRLPPVEVRGMYGVRVGSTPTLTLALAQAGYHTLGFHSNPFLWRVFGFDRGFADFYDDMFLPGARLPVRLRLLLNRVHRLRRLTPYLPAAALNRKVLAGLARAREPFFLWVHYMDTHGPYQSRRGWGLAAKLRAERLWHKAAHRPTAVTPAERDTLWAWYRERVAYVDEQLGLLLGTLAGRGLLERSLLILTADHGDEFSEHGGYTHTHQLYDELIHVPLFFRVPGVAPRRVEEVVELVQIVPTVLDFLGLPEPNPLDGKSLRSTMAGGRDGLRGTALSEAELAPHYIVCLRDREWKLICRPGSGPDELYHLLEDPAEQRNVLAAHPEVAAALRRDLDARRRTGREAARAERLSPEDEQLVEARLRDLGYL